MSQEVHGLREFLRHAGGAGRGPAAAGAAARALAATAGPVRAGDRLCQPLPAPVAGAGGALRRPAAGAAAALALAARRRQPAPRSAEEEALPFPDLIFDRILLVHGLEAAENARRLLREAWRVLKDDGRLLVVAPNRRGCGRIRNARPSARASPIRPARSSGCCAGRCSGWSGGTPRCMCRPSARGCCCAAPGPGRGWGRCSIPRFAGLTLMEAEKDMFAGLPVAKVKARRRVVMPEGV